MRKLTRPRRKSGSAIPGSPFPSPREAQWELRPSHSRLAASLRARNNAFSRSDDVFVALSVFRNFQITTQKHTLTKASGDVTLGGVIKQETAPQVVAGAKRALPGHVAAPDSGQ
jgi:hypothetical protein